MPRYEHPDISFDIPRDWEDRSVAAFTGPVSPNHKFAPNVVATRDKLEPGENIVVYADRQLVELGKRLDQFVLQKRAETTVSGQPAVELRFLWRGAQGIVAQRLVMCATGKRLVLSLTSTVPRAMAAEIDPVMDRILQTVKIPGERSAG